jgi:hypothetical protein
MAWDAVDRCGSGNVYRCVLCDRHEDKPSTGIPDDDSESPATFHTGSQAKHLTPLTANAASDFAAFLREPAILVDFGSLMGLTILWDFLLMVPMYLQDTLALDTAQASRAASAFPLGSLISVLIGGFVFDRLDRKKWPGSWRAAADSNGCLVVFATLPQWQLTGSASDAGFSDPVVRVRTLPVSLLLHSCQRVFDRLRGSTFRISCGHS